MEMFFEQFSSLQHSGRSWKTAKTTASSPSLAEDGTLFEREGRVILLDRMVTRVQVKRMWIGCSLCRYMISKG